MMLYNILVAAAKAGIYYVSFGLRQQLLIDVPSETCPDGNHELKKLDIHFEPDTDDFPNIVSSYPAEEVFIHNTWLSEGVYKDIFDTIDYQPRLKINISDSNQSFTPNAYRECQLGGIRQQISIFGTYLFVFPKPISFTNGIKWCIPMM